MTEGSRTKKSRQDHLGSAFARFAEHVVRNTTQGTSQALLFFILVGSAVAWGAATFRGGDWRNVVPSACIGLVLGQQLICACNAVWGRGRLAARIFLQCAAIGVSAPAATAAVRGVITREELLQWCATLFTYSTSLMLASATAHVVGIRVAWPSTVPHRSARQWSIFSIFSLTTAIGIWLGTAVAVAPFLRYSRYSALHWGLTLSVGGVWTVFACAVCALRPTATPRLMLIPPVAALAGPFVSQWLEVGQADGAVQLWFAGPHQEAPGLDYMLSSGLVAQLLVLEVPVAMVTGFLFLWRIAGARLTFARPSFAWWGQNVSK